MKQNNYFRRTLSALLLLTASTLTWAYDFKVDDIYYNIIDEESVEVTNNNGSNDYMGNIIIPSTVTYDGKTYHVVSIGNSTFDSCYSLTSINIPESVNSIGNWAFMGCRSLTSIIIPDGVTSIGSQAFRGCSSLTSITIGNGVTNIEAAAFPDCPSLKSMIVSEDNPVYDSREGCNAIIKTATNTLISGCKNTIIPKSVTRIEMYAFNECTALTSIVIPESVTSIGEGAFWKCNSLTSINIPDDVAYINYGTFYECSSLISIDIPDGVDGIGYAAFYHCSSLTSVTIGKGVTNISESAFEYCSSLTTVICRAENMPRLEWGIFTNVPTSEATLYVPASAIEDYKAADQWKEFGTILPLEAIPTGIDSPTKEKAGNAPYYTLDGKPAARPTRKGIYVKDGKKVMVK